MKTEKEIRDRLKSLMAARSTVIRAGASGGNLGSILSVGLAIALTTPEVAALTWVLGEDEPKTEKKP